MAKAAQETNGLLKALFAGEIREDLLLPYPQLGVDEGRVVERLLAGWRTFAREKVNARAIDEEECIPDEVKQGLARLGMFGLIIPQQYGGLGLGAIAYGRVIEAVTAVCPALTLMLGAHLSIGLKGLLLYGNDEQKARYLPRLATGDSIAAFALTEPQTGSDASALRSTAVRDGQGWRLNGSKIWISNGDIADMITVFAVTPEMRDNHSLTAFLVEPGFEGFSLGPNARKLGLHGSNASVLRFDNVPIPPGNVLGQPGEGFKIAVHVLNSGRVGLGAACVGGMKHALEVATKWVLERKAFGATISEYELVQSKIAQMAVDIFAAESMAVMAAGLADRGSVDYEVEAAVVKVFASEGMWRCADELVQLAGGRGYVKPFPYERILRDTRVNRIFEGTNEILRLFIFDQGTKALRRYLRRVARSPLGILELAAHSLSHLGEPPLRRSTDTRLSEMADLFRDAALHLHRDTQAVLQRERKAIVHKQLLMARVADMAIETFGMAAVLSRLHSLTSGATANDGELSAALDLAELYYHQAADRFEGHRAALQRNCDQARVKAARLVYDHGGYPFVDRV